MCIPTSQLQALHLRVGKAQAGAQPPGGFSPCLLVPVEGDAAVGLHRPGDQLAHVVHQRREPEQWIREGSGWPSGSGGRGGWVRPSYAGEAGRSPSVRAGFQIGDRSPSSSKAPGPTSSTARILNSSSRTRSALRRRIPAASASSAVQVSRSMSKSSWAANRTARKSRSASSRSRWTGSPTVRIRPSFEVPGAAEGIDQLPGAGVPRQRIDGEVPAREVFLDGDAVSHPCRAPAVRVVQVPPERGDVHPKARLGFHPHRAEGRAHRHGAGEDRLDLLRPGVRRRDRNRAAGGPAEGPAAPPRRGTPGTPGP